MAVTKHTQFCDGSLKFVFLGKIYDINNVILNRLLRNDYRALCEDL